MFVLVISMWGQTADNEWKYIGNQYVLNEEFTKAQCEQIIEDKSWSRHEENEWYRIQLDCQKV